MLPVLSILLVLSSSLVFDFAYATPCCPEGFSLYMELTPSTKPTCYKAVDDWNANFDKALTGCKALGSRLATIHTPNENLFVLGLAKNISMPNYMWIGLTKNEKVPVTSKDLAGNWFWMEDNIQPGYTNWLKGFPGNFVGQTCAIMYVNPGNFGSLGGEWRDVSCEQLQAPYVCEKDACICGKTCDHQ